MSIPRPPEPRRETPRNVDQYRHETDAGTFGDKVAVGDPAAAPIGTDDEAAGTPVPAHVVAATAAHQAATAGPAAAAIARESSTLVPHRRNRAAIGWLLLLVALLGFGALLFFATGGTAT